MVPPLMQLRDGWMETALKDCNMAWHFFCSASEMVHHLMLLWPNTETQRQRHLSTFPPHVVHEKHTLHISKIQRPQTCVFSAFPTYTTFWFCVWKTHMKTRGVCFNASQATQVVSHRLVDQTQDFCIFFSHKAHHTWEMKIYRIDVTLSVYLHVIFRFVLSLWLYFIACIFKTLGLSKSTSMTKKTQNM